MQILSTRPATEKPSPRAGVQAVDRALAVLLRLAVDAGPGMRLKEIAHDAGLDPATTHRLLGSLRRFGLVDQDGETKRYGLGLEFFAVAAAAANKFQFAASIRPALRALGAQSGACALFFVGSGPDLVCVEMQAGRRPSAYGPGDLGSRRPIGVGAVGIAYLAALPDPEIEAIVLHTVRRLEMDPEAAVRGIRDAIVQARADGYALAEDIAVGFLTLAMSVHGCGSRPEAVLALNGPARLFSGGRAARLVAALADQVRQIEVDLASHHPAASEAHACPQWWNPANFIS